MLTKIYSGFAAIRKEFQAKRKDLDHVYSVEIFNGDGSNLVIDDLQRLPAERAEAARV